MTYIRTVNSANISEADREKQVFLIKRENSNILQNLSVLEDEERTVVRSKSDQIRHLAQNYERLAELGEYKEPISHICSTIVRLCIDQKLMASAQLARAVLDSKYKQTEFTSHNNLVPDLDLEPTADNSTLDTSMPKVESNDYFETDYRIADVLNSSSGMPGRSAFVDPTSSEIFAVDKPPEQMSRDELRQIAEARVQRYRKSREQLLEDRRRQNEILEECDRRKIALSPEFEQLSANHISAISPDSGESEAWAKCVQLTKSYEKLCDKLFRWRPPKHLQQKLVLAFEEEIAFLEPFIDEKHRKCQPAWWVVQLDNIWHGKHAAAIKGATVIGENVKRALTREQVGDRSEADVKRAIRFCLAQKARAALWEWFANGPEKGIAIRAKELGPELSDKAFS